ncbi:hypothetical protein M0R88_14100 [Halorussus gelatinilyticus]|uniref:Uncharacterized protein n=1 Tax=Halorussus gelatinilyticus TaxID=2937524 RepID=A0A8U0IHB0_9EURY|nr:hypothetical protein [Halorussus gelatinilyticus]UPV99641.1 hypothetical protein M0R88_14100 [Halorussus gelatinilyticus]
MADVRHRLRGSRGDRDREGGGGDRRDRGQLILVTGLAVAVTLVALVLLLNTVIYTQNLATRGAEVEDDAAVSFRQEAIAGVGEVVDAENRAEYQTRAKVEANVTAGIERYDSVASRYRAERSTIAQVDTGTLSLTEGRILRQTNASRNFTSAGGANGWTLVEDAGSGTAPGVRRFRLTVNRDELSQTKSDAFTVVADGSSREWRARIYNPSGGATVAVAVKNGSEGTADTVCSVTAASATVDLTSGRLGGERCPALDWAKGVAAPYDVRFERADDATGTYEVTVDTSAAGTAVQTGNFAGPGAGQSPRWAPAVYAAEFEIHFETPNVAFHTTVRAAPGEPR